MSKKTNIEELIEDVEGVEAKTVFNEDGLDVLCAESAIVKDEPKPTPTPSNKFNIGDKVVINGALYRSSNDNSAAGYANNKTAYITKYVAGSKHPYNTTGDLGWVDEGAITAYSGGIKYTVKKGDILSGIAAKYGMTWQQIYARNKFVIGNNPNIIKPGQVLVIKD